MMRVEKGECSTSEIQGTSKRVLKIEGEDYEFELITEDEMEIIEGIPDEPSQHHGFGA